MGIQYLQSCHNGWASNIFNSVIMYGHQVSSIMSLWMGKTSFVSLFRIPLFHYVMRYIAPRMNFQHGCHFFNFVVLGNARVNETSRALLLLPLQYRTKYRPVIHQYQTDLLMLSPMLAHHVPCIIMGYHQLQIDMEAIGTFYMANHFSCSLVSIQFPTHYFILQRDVGGRDTRVTF